MAEGDSPVGDLTHGVVKGEAQNLDEEVDGVAGQVPLGPALVALFEDQAGIGGREEIACGLFDELERTLLEQRQVARPGGRRESVHGTGAAAGSDEGVLTSCARVRVRDRRIRRESF